jgi:NitT/TauT family transport system ATP-binding protein
MPAKGVTEAPIKAASVEGRIGVSAEGVSRTFVSKRGHVKALEGLSLRAYPGEILAVVGPSGCGKSTLLHILGGFIAADAGEIRVSGRAVGGPGPDRGMVFQEFALFPWRTVAGNVGWALEVQGCRRSEREAVVDRLLAVMNLTEFRNHLPGELSGGMKQRVALARVLAFDPRVLLMDEPFGALDAQTRETMQEELTRLWERTAKTILFVTHDIEEAVYLGDRVIVLSARPGRVREQITIDLPRPRGLEVKKSIPCLEYRNYIWDLIRGEAAPTTL